MDNTVHHRDHDREVVTVFYLTRHTCLATTTVTAAVVLRGRVRDPSSRPVSSRLSGSGTASGREMGGGSHRERRLDLGKGDIIDSPVLAVY